jgi:stalled ribosome rescue protein Dom34
MSHHVAVWLDQHEARVYQLHAEGFDVANVHAPERHVHRHPTVTASHNHPTDLQHFLKEVTLALEGAKEILVVGPATAKLELLKYLHKHAPAVATNVVGVETVDHPTDGQLVAYAKKYFRAADPLLK